MKCAFMFVRSNTCARSPWVPRVCAIIITRMRLLSAKTETRYNICVCFAYAPPFPRLSPCMHSTASSSSSQRPLFININAGVLLENGKAWNIRKVSRHADACMILEGNVLRFYGFLMIDKVDVSTLRVCKAFSGLSGWVVRVCAASTRKTLVI